MVGFAKVSVLLGSAWTLVCIGMVVGAQLASSLSATEAQDFSLRAVFAKLNHDGAIYRPASETAGIHLLGLCLDFSVLVPLLIAAALQIGFYLWLRQVTFDRRPRLQR